MNIDYLNSFIETANQKSMSKASEQLNISQPALSKQIRNVEDYFGTPLLTRSTSGIALTEEGEIVFKRIQLILADLSSLQKDLKEMRGMKGYTIGTLPSLAGNYIPSRIVELKKKGFKADVVVRNTSAEVFELLKKGELDAAIIETMPDNKTTWSKKLLEEPLYAVVPDSHQLSRKESVRLEEMGEDEFVLYPPNCSIRQCISNLFIRQEKELKVKTEVDFGEFLIGYVAAGAGITVVPEIAAKYIGHSFVKAIPISDPSARRQVSLLSNSKSVGTFLYGFFM